VVVSAGLMMKMVLVAVQVLVQVVVLGVVQVATEHLARDMLAVAVHRLTTMVTLLVEEEVRVVLAQLLDNLLLPIGGTVVPGLHLVSQVLL
jgi:hypothetical protein